MKTKPKKNKRAKKWSNLLLDAFLAILLLSIFFIVIYSAMQEDNHDRRVLVPEALDAPYQPYRPSMPDSPGGQMTPIDSMMRDVYVVQREINQGSHQLYLFFDTFTHEPAPLDLKHFDLKNPHDAQWYNLAIYVVMLLIVATPLWLTYFQRKIIRDFFNKTKGTIEDKDKYETHWMKKFLDFIKANRMMIVVIVFMLAILLSMVNLSIPLDKEYEYRADPFFVFVCFSAIGVSVFSVKYVIKDLKHLKVGGDTSLKGKNTFRQTLIWGALGAWAMGFMCYFIGMYSLGTQKSVLASIVRPALESGKMFVLSDNVKEISFTLRNNGAFMGFYTLCKLAFLLISSFALVSLAWSRINSFWSIWDRSRGPGELYVFFGINDNTKIMAKDVARKLRNMHDSNHTIVMVENRNTPVDGMGSGMSISSLVGMFNFRKDAYAEVQEISPHALLVISDSAISSRECSHEVGRIMELINSGHEVDQNERYALFNSLGLKNLSKMIKNAQRCHFFFLDNNDRANIDATDNLRKMLDIVHRLKGEATIYCLARKNAFSALLETPLHSMSAGEKDKGGKVRVKTLDISVMAAQSLFKDPDNHPINFVDCDTATASVKSRFESLVIGFGRGGRDIVSYLYEFGAFLDHSCIGPDGDGRPIRRSPFQCTIVDKDVDLIRPRYMAKIPAVQSARNNDEEHTPLLRFEQAALNSDRFVELVNEKLSNRDMNFVVINMGSDKTNMGALTFMIDQAMRVRNGKLGKLRFFVRNYDPNYESTLKEQAEHFNQLLGGDKKVVSIFGNRLDLLTFDMMVDDSIEQAAKHFYYTYNKLKNVSDADWDKRHDEGRGITTGSGEYMGITWQRQNRVVRQETQDIHNGMHIPTKLRLIGINGTGDEQQQQLLSQLEEAIKFSENGCQFSFSASSVMGLDVQQLYLNLARNEHIRWAASLEMLGYTGAPAGTLDSCDEAAKVHPCLVDWNQLDAVTAYHNRLNPDSHIDYKALDYLVIKSTLELAREA